MKPRLVVYISLFALTVLILIQFYIINQVYRLKANEFDLKYTGLVQQSLYDLEYYSGENGLDSVFYHLEEASVQSLDRIRKLAFVEDTLEAYSGIIGTFEDIILSHESLSPYIRSYLSEHQADPDFNSGIVIRNLVMLDFPDELIVYSEAQNFTTPFPQPESGSLKNALQVNSYTAEGNYYRIAFDFYIDFTHKKRIIYREMAGIFTLSVITIVIVLFIFMYTIRNMLKQKKLSDMKTDFINNMTHELKTPLTTIAVASSSLADPSIHSNEDRVVEISRMIGKQNRHLNQLIDHILDIELWERDQVSLTIQPVNISAFLHEKLGSFRIEHTDESITILEDFDLKGEKVKLDEFQFTRVMNNLLSNAVKYSFEKPEISVKAELTDKLVISVKDNGIGIDPESQKHIFSRFYRANTGDIHKVKGLGLGLYYVKKIVEAHGGEISVDSKPNHGSTFIIELPK